MLFEDNEELQKEYPFLHQYTSPVKPMERELVGRKDEMRRLMAAMRRPELCNVILLAEAGAGKTALVQGTMAKDVNRMYLEVDLSKMIADLKNENEMADKLKQLFNETQVYGQKQGRELVLFMDEFHQIVQLSSAAVEVLKPLLADSGTRGIRVIAATTYIEFRKWIAPNQPLVERLQRINIAQPDKKMTVAILRNFAKRYGVEDQFYNDHMFELIYDYTNRYIPANSQPRKSILILDSMIGWYRAEGRKLDKKLLGDVIYETEGVNVAFKVDATSIKSELDAHVLSQKYATSAIAQRLQLCVADLNDKSKPMSSFLFTGSTGVGKLVADYEPVPVFTEHGPFLKPHGELQVGDFVFDRTGKPTKIIGTFPHKNVEMYRVTLSDGRTLDVGDEHLWSVYSSKQKSKHDKGMNVPLTVMTTKELFDKGVVRTYKKDTRKHLKWFIPMNGAVEWPANDLKVHPYVLGALIGDGCLTSKPLNMSSDDKFVVEKVGKLIGAKSCVKNKDNYTWSFELPEKQGNRKYFYTDELLSDYPLTITYSSKRQIPADYVFASIEQRWSLIHGLFDTDGSVSNDDRIRVTYSTFSETLAFDIQKILYSLGVSSTISLNKRVRKDELGNVRNMNEYTLHVKASDETKLKMFTLPQKLETIHRNMRHDKQRIEKFDFVGIADIQKIGVQDAQCIYVDNDEHLYQAGMFVVTHNTEMTKQLAQILFADDRSLIRFDMTEYALPESLERFRRELTAKVWEHPYSIVLLDEIEKACAPVTRILLQVLDDGRLMDENSREVTFTNAYIVITTNSGSEIYKNIAQYQADDEGSGAFVKKYDKLIRQSISSTNGDNKFPPELLGRIDSIVPFQPLSEETMKKIVMMKLSKLRDLIREKHNIQIIFSKDIIDYLVEDNMDTDSDSGGARKVMSKLESEVTTSVARFINTYPEVNKLKVCVEGELASRNKTKLESDAYIKIQAFK